MSEVERLKRILLALPQLHLRIGWLKERLSEWPVEGGAVLLNGLCEQAERSDPAAREAQLALALCLITIGECELTSELRRVAEARHLLSLERMLRRGPPPSVRGQLPELPVPNYGTGRELTVGERRSLARRPDRRAFDKLLSDPHPLVIRQLLQNPKLTENDVLRLVSRRPVRAAVFEELARAPAWLCRRRVRMAILLNPGSPGSLSLPLLGMCTRTELREIVSSTDTPPVVRATALELLERRPPLRDSESGLVVQ